MPEPVSANARRPPPPMDPPMVPVTLAGLAAWTAAGLVLLVVDGPAGWLRICLAGLLVGLAMLAVMLVRDRRRKRRQQT